MIVLIQCVILGLGRITYEPDFMENDSVSAYHRESGDYANRPRIEPLVLWPAHDCIPYSMPTIEREPITGDDIRQVYIEWENDASYPGEKPEYEDYLAEWLNERL